MKLTRAQRREVRKMEKVDPRHYEFHPYPGEEERYRAEQDRMAKDPAHYRWDSVEGEYVPREMKTQY